MEMRALYYVMLPSAESGGDPQQRDDDIRANENCLNQNFTLLAGKIAEFEARLAVLEAQNANG